MMEKGVLQSIQEAGSLFFGPLWSFVVAFLAIVVGIIVSRYAQRLIRAALGWTSMGETTIFTNLVRIIIALLVAIFISDTVFHVKLTVFAPTLGISALIVSLGLQDLVKNIVAGIQIVGGHLFSAGDQLEVGDVRGEVMDVSWRQTVLRDKDNNTHVLPNAALMSEAFMRRENKMIDRYTIDCDIKPGLDLQRVAEDIEQLADQVLEEKGWRTERCSEVRYVGSTANGVKASVRIFIKDISHPTNAMDAVMRAIGQRGYLADWTNDDPMQDAWR